MKPLRRLYHQFGSLSSPRLDSYEVAERLNRAGYIELIAYEGDRPTHYRETEKMRVLPTDYFTEIILNKLKEII